MAVAYKKHYTEEVFDNFTLYGQPSLNSTNVFWNYYIPIINYKDETKENIIQKIKTHIPQSKARINIVYDDDKIEFFKPNKNIFPEFYIIFK